MKQSRAFVTQRRNTIVKMLTEQHRIRVSELAQALDVSPLTARRDLDWLEAQGIVKRRYGTAILASLDRYAGTDAHEKAKRSIARHAANLVENHESLFVNTSSTALLALEYLTATDTTIITNSMHIQSLSLPPSTTILITGGEIRPPRGILSGEFALANIRTVAPTKCFIGCAGISLTDGITSTTLQEATVNAHMIDRSDQVILLADSGKFGIGAGFTYAALNQIDLLITDNNMTESCAQALIDAGIRATVRVALDT